MVVFIICNPEIMKPVIILGSERYNGNTHKVTVQLAKILNCPIINLLDYTIERYSYESNYSDNDNFIEIMKNITDSHDVLIFSTPVYWYSMSGLMKIFFDRITDLLKAEKETGRKLRGKSIAVLTSSNGSNLGENFWIPFKHTADYLGMKFLGGVHTYEDKNNEHAIESFALKLK